MLFKPFDNKVLLYLEGFNQTMVLIMYMIATPLLPDYFVGQTEFKMKFAWMIIGGFILIFTVNFGIIIVDTLTKLKIWIMNSKRCKKMNKFNEVEILAMKTMETIPYDGVNKK
jgi:hypothetical protein